MMFAKVWLINIVLGAIVFSVTLQAVDVWTRTETSLPGSTASNQEKPPVQRRVIPPETEPETAYDLIPEKTLFSEDRAEFVSETGEAEPGITRVSASRKPVFLYGVVMVGDYRKALVRENAGKSGDDRWVFEGDKLAGMTVTAIQKEKLILTSNSETLEVLLYDGGKPKSPHPVVAQTETPVVVTLSSEGAAPSPKENGDQQKPGGQEKPVTKKSPSATQPENGKAEKGSVKKTEVDSAESGFDRTESTPPQASIFPQLPKQDNQTSPNAKGEQTIVPSPFGGIMRKTNSE